MKTQTGFSQFSSFSFHFSSSLSRQYSKPATTARSHSGSQSSALKLPASPPRLPVIGNLHQLGRFPHRSIAALADKYGPIMLLHLGRCPTLVVSSPDLVKQIVKNHDVVFSNRPKTTATDIMFYQGRSIAFSSYGDFWRQTRKICAVHLLSVKRVLSFQPVREEEALVLLDLIRRASSARVPVNLSKILIAASNNIVTRCILGKSYNKTGEEEEEGGRDKGSRLRELGNTAVEQLLELCVGDLFPSLRWIDVAQGFIRRLKSTAGAFDAFYDQVIEEHRAAMIKERARSGGISSSKVKDLVDILLELDHTSLDTDQLSHQHYVKTIVQDVLIAGIETSSTAMEWVMAELLQNARVMKKAQEEVRRVVGDNKPNIDMDDINQMCYLKCIVKETSESMELVGYHIPAKTKVLVNGWAIHRHPGSWERPEEFIPERFENSSIDYKAQEHFELIPFGFGRRQCPGLTSGIASIEYLVSNLLYWFDWKPSKGDQHELDALSPEDIVDMSEVYGMVVHKKNPLYVIATPYSP